MNRFAVARALTLVTVLIALLLAGAAVAMEAGDFDASLARAKAEGKPLIIDFYTDW